MSMEFTVEEINLMCIYDTGSRERLVNGIIEGMGDVDDPELSELMQNTADKLAKLSDREFAELSFFPEYGLNDSPETEV